MNLQFEEEKEYLSKTFKEEFNYYFYQEKKKHFEIVFLCIGCDNVIGDSLGPLVGTILEEKLEQYNIFNFEVYGTLKKNVTYTNIEEIVEKINKKHKNACIIVIDAALSKKENIGKIFVSNNKMVIGKGLNKEKKEIGDISIKAVVGKDYKFSNYNFFVLKNISLQVILKLATLIADGILDTIKYI